MISMVQDCSIASALAMEIVQSCTKPSIYPWNIKCTLTNNPFCCHFCWISDGGHHWPGTHKLNECNTACQHCSIHVFLYMVTIKVALHDISIFQSWVDFPINLICHRELNCMSLQEFGFYEMCGINMKGLTISLPSNPYDSQQNGHERVKNQHNL